MWGPRDVRFRHPPPAGAVVSKPKATSADLKIYNHLTTEKVCGLFPSRCSTSYLCGRHSLPLTWSTDVGNARKFLWLPQLSQMILYRSMRGDWNLGRGWLLFVLVSYLRAIMLTKRMNGPLGSAIRTVALHTSNYRCCLISTVTAHIREYASRGHAFVNIGVQ
jgi:hypothetical protein